MKGGSPGVTAVGHVAGGLLTAPGQGVLCLDDRHPGDRSPPHRGPIRRHHLLRAGWGVGGGGRSAAEIQPELAASFLVSPHPHQGLGSPRLFQTWDKPRVRVKVSLSPTPMLRANQHGSHQPHVAL